MKGQFLNGKSTLISINSIVLTCTVFRQRCVHKSLWGVRLLGESYLLRLCIEACHRACPYKKETINLIKKRIKKIVHSYRRFLVGNLFSYLCRSSVSINLRKFIGVEKPTAGISLDALGVTLRISTLCEHIIMNNAYFSSHFLYTLLP